MQQFYVGTYAQGEGDIFTIALKGNPAKLELTSVLGGCENASFLALGHGRLYAVSERPDGGDICTFSLSAACAPVPLARIAAPYPALCHISVWPDGRALSAASYLGGGVCTCALGAEGTPLAPPQWIPNQGNGSNPQRQESAHAHSITPDPTGRYFIQADLGTDELLVFRPQGTRLALHGRVRVPSGEGPRHFVFHPTGRYGYLVTELKNHVIVFEYDGEKGLLRQRQTCALLQGGEPPTCLAADIHLSGDGRYLYASVRGVPHIVKFSVEEDGALANREFLPCGAAAVRNFCVTREGAHMLIADQLADEVRLFSLHQENGTLGACLDSIRIPSPVCILEA